MTKRKQSEAPTLPVPKTETAPVGIAQVGAIAPLSRSAAQVFAGQRRHAVITSEEGEQFKALLIKSGLKFQVRAGVGYEMITIQWGRVVIQK